MIFPPDLISAKYIRQIFVAGINITGPVRFLEVGVGSPRSIIHRQFGFDGDKDWQMMAGQ